jgi:hypothetical protein
MEKPSAWEEPAFIIPMRLPQHGLSMGHASGWRDASEDRIVCRCRHLATCRRGTYVAGSPPGLFVRSGSRKRKVRHTLGPPPTECWKTSPRPDAHSPGWNDTQEDIAQVITPSVNRTSVRHERDCD